MAAPRKPQDRKPKAASTAFTFTAGDATYTLPPAQSVASHVDGRTMRDAVMGGEEGQLRLAFTMLDALDTEPGTLDALYGMPAPEMLEIVQAWMTHKPADGVSLGE